MNTSWLNWRTLIVDARDLSFGAKAMALYLNTYMNDRHDCAWPSLARICGEMSISRPTAIKYLAELESGGWVSKQRAHHASTTYYAIIPERIIEVFEGKESLLSEAGQSKNSLPVKVKSLNTNNQENKQDPPYSPPKGDDPDFDAFWSAYPRKVGKGAARKAWRKARGKEKPKRIIEAVRQHQGSEQWQLDGGKFIPHPSTWLNQERWLDELAGQASTKWERMK